MTPRILLGVLTGSLLLLSGRGLHAESELKDRVQAAINRGVASLKQSQGKNGGWSYSGGLATGRNQEGPQQDVGSTSLAALALLECGVPAKDAAVQKAAALVREASPTLTYTYSISLAIMFLDRLGDPADVSLVDSLAIRLLAGQLADGGWSYFCPALSPAEVRRLTDKAKEHSELIAKGKLPVTSVWPPKIRDPKDLPRSVLLQLRELNQKEGLQTADNSNTQFATLALWIGRRHGLPVDGALARVETRMRRCQTPRGGWGYTMRCYDIPLEMVGKPNVPQGAGPRASMTCAGLLCLAAGNGAVNNRALAKGSKAVRTLAEDPNAVKGLQMLSLWIGNSGKSVKLKDQDFYFLWSLERVGVVYGTTKINKKDWYQWGAEALIENQAGDGGWRGMYPQGGVDTSFALLFLCRSNLFPDLTASLKGTRWKKGEASLSSGGVGGGKLIGGNEGTQANPRNKGTEAADQDKEIARRTKELVEASPAEQEKIIARLEREKGVENTEALAGAIPMLRGALKDRAREALAERLTRMKATTLRDKFQDDNLEVRRAAALACAKKKARDLVPDLIKLLNDPELPVVLGAHKALVQLTGKDFGPEADATRAERKEAVAKWQAWWKEQGK